VNSMSIFMVLDLIGRHIYGPRSHWPTEEKVREFESGKKP